MTNLCLDYGRAKAASGAPAAAVAAPSSSRAKCNGGTPAEDEPLHPPPLRPKQKGGSPAAPSVLRFRGEGISAISADLAPLAGSLRRLELPYNDLSSGKPLAGLAALPGLTYLDLSGNRLRDLAGVQVCENLTGEQPAWRLSAPWPQSRTEVVWDVPILPLPPPRSLLPSFHPFHAVPTTTADRAGFRPVLNVSHNKIKDISHHVLSCKKLKALVANDNEIASAELVSKLSELSTIGQFLLPPFPPPERARLAVLIIRRSV
ncbi:MAG: hypothetical protein BJ554DRAFT_7021 [Olpidium bornovanus]|uniref:Uncharacterized protein n=1 Tax=Olpidium bornovanus TaxID=278681 RepID=A0A8H8DJR8_9FUNG|nr:MAG: hypothetical protein BJ554DRAFT_7021 [Olpidium bornovanus]